MIGGTVVKVKVLKDRVWVNCEEDNSTSQCAIYVEKNPKSLCIEPGDSVWWQGGFAMWTPYFNRKKTCDHQHHYSCARVGKDYDIRIPRIGFSGVKEPKELVKEGGK